MKTNNPQNISALLMEHLRAKGLKGQSGITPVWAGYTARPFPPARLPDGRALVLRENARLHQGTSVWYRLEGGFLAFAMEFLPQ
ncbi:MAG: hypothetical protein QXD60_02990 [Nanopusillaceae archaeon]